MNDTNPEAILSMKASELKDNPVIPAEKFLEHHGVKGQKWGVRRNRADGRGGKLGKGAPKKSSRTHFEKKAHRLSDADLQDRIKRMELEKKYNDLNAKQVSAGKKFTQDLIHNTGKTVATTILTGVALLTITHALGKKFNPETVKQVTGKSIPVVKETGSAAFKAARAAEGLSFT